MIRSHLEPVRVEMSADEAILGYEAIEFTSSFDAVVGVDPIHAREAIGISLNDVDHEFGIEFPRSGQTAPPDLCGDQQRSLDAGLVHHLYVALDRRPFHELAWELVLARMERLGPRRARVNDLRCEEVR